MAVPPPMTMAPDDTVAQKRRLRMAMRTLRRGFVMGGTAAEIELPAFLRPRITPGIVVTAYIPMRFEADPMPMARAAGAMGAQLALPHCVDLAAPMRFLAWASGDPLVVNHMGLSQPMAESPELTPDIILAPLLAFDAALHRMGQGAGFYDRAFARYPDALRIGVAWSVQQVPAVPVDPWDVPLHAVVTERGAIYHREP